MTVEVGADVATLVTAGASAVSAAMSAPILRRACGGPLAALVADPRFAGVLGRDARQHEEVLALAARIGRR